MFAACARSRPHSAGALESKLLPASLRCSAPRCVGSMAGGDRGSPGCETHPGPSRARPPECRHDARTPNRASSLDTPASNSALTRPPAATPATAPTAVAANQPAATTGPRPGIASGPRPARRRRPLPMLAPAAGVETPPKLPKPTRENPRPARRVVADSPRSEACSTLVRPRAQQVPVSSVLAARRGTAGCPWFSLRRVPSPTLRRRLIAPPAIWLANDPRCGNSRRRSCRCLRCRMGARQTSRSRLRL